MRIKVLIQFVKKEEEEQGSNLEKRLVTIFMKNIFCISVYYWNVNFLAF